MTRERVRRGLEMAIATCVIAFVVTLAVPLIGAATALTHGDAALARQRAKGVVMAPLVLPLLVALAGIYHRVTAADESRDEPPAA